MRAAYVVSYDICDPKRLRKVYKTMHGFGEHIQLSVFRCELSATHLEKMIGKLEKIIHHREDQVMIIYLGPADGRSKKAIRTLGKAYKPVEREPMVF